LYRQTDGWPPSQNGGTMPLGELNAHTGIDRSRRSQRHEWRAGLRRYPGAGEESDYLAAGDGLERFLDHFPSVTREQAVAALEVAADLLAEHARPAR
jgi:hypothetical protein